MTPVLPSEGIRVQDSPQRSSDAEVDKEDALKHSIYLNDTQKKQLEFEVVSTEVRVFLTRLIGRDSRMRHNSIHHINYLVNRARSLVGLPIYVLEGDDWGEYEPGEYAWHNGEFELLLRRLDTQRFIEFVAELIEHQWLRIIEVNRALMTDTASFRFTHSSEGEVEVEVRGIEELREEPLAEEHPNMRILIDRMDTCLNTDDPAGVLHASASVFETLAKQVVAIPSIQNQTLKGFFDRYAKDSRLPKELQDKILATYEERNRGPLSGHGSLETPTITKSDAIVLCELTKSFVRIEYLLDIENQKQSTGGQRERSGQSP